MIVERQLLFPLFITSKGLSLQSPKHLSLKIYTHLGINSNGLFTILILQPWEQSLRPRPTSLCRRQVR